MNTTLNIAKKPTMDKAPIKPVFQKKENLNIMQD